mmetsp:Transcript_14480/g.52088  ORF Transcript_14480/g.52088 Transcript_14480/m.52088 type:complete len:96 (-) Transcript_14480:2220-2507(-)
MSGASSRSATSSNHVGTSSVRTMPSSDAVRRRTSGVSGPFRSANNGNGMSMLRFYTEEAQGLKITPVLVLVISVCFIAFVTMLHAISKIYQYRNS